MKVLSVMSYGFQDLLRSKWILIYTLFYFLFTSGLFFISMDVTKVVISLLNIVLIISPLMGIIISIMYYYNSREFIEFLLAQPVSRSTIILGLYGSIAISLMFCIVVGIGLPAIIFGTLSSPHWYLFFYLIAMGAVLSFIFSGLAFLIALKNENRIKGFGIAILMWFFLALMYDGILLLALLYLKDYPLEKFALTSMIFNPIDLARTFILLKLDISALMGYTGAVIQKFYSGLLGKIIILFCLLLWIIVPAFFIKKIGNKKDW